MKLSEALRIINSSPKPNATKSTVFLAVGFMPLHLETFFKAHLIQQAEDKSVEVFVGTYNDLRGNLERARDSSCQSVASVIEWPDLDPRLGLRRLGGWGAGHVTDILSTIKRQASRLTILLDEIANHKPIALALPTLPLPPVGFTHHARAGKFELELRRLVDQIAITLAGNSNARIVNAQELNFRSSLGERLDVHSELQVGFPYTLTHASDVAEFLAILLNPEQSKKGLITDLDDTLWDGILGEVGISGISWNLESNTQIHGLYQQLVSGLGDSGALIAVASKNEGALVKEAFERDDMLLSPEQVFPFEVNWGRKSESICRILEKWNIGADAVVFVDDSPMEIAEVAASHPNIECLRFPKGDDQAVYALLMKLQNLFGKDFISAEDSLRRESLRQRNELNAAMDSADSLDAFLKDLHAELEFDWSRSNQDSRALELINKTNQFNLNGRRVDEGKWLELLQDTTGVLLEVSYRDKFGPLGKIAVLYGRLSEKYFSLDTWVMSCRAFSRRIEYACLQQVFDKLGVELVSFNYFETQRNGPVAGLLEEILGEKPSSGEILLSRQMFEKKCPPLFHSHKEYKDYG